MGEKHAFFFEIRARITRDTIEKRAVPFQIST